MSFIEDFPHTSIYDKDLGWLIRQYKELNGNYEVLKDIYNIVKEQIHDVTIAQLQEWLNDGTLENKINDTLFKSKIDKKDIMYLGDFNGDSDVDKLINALNTIEKGYIIINNLIINKKIVLNDYEKDYRSIYIVGGTIQIDIDRPIDDINKDFKSFRFLNCNIDSTSNYTIYNVKNLIGVSFINCYIHNVELYNNISGYVQSLELNNTTYYNNYLFIKCLRVYDFKIVNCQLEWAEGRVLECVDSTDSSYENLKIIHNLIEGRHSTTPFVLTSGRTLIVDGNYLEHNSRGLIKFNENNRYKKIDIVFTNNYVNELVGAEFEYYIDFPNDCDIIAHYRGNTIQTQTNNNLIFNKTVDEMNLYYLTKTDNRDENLKSFITKNGYTVYNQVNSLITDNDGYNWRIDLRTGTYNDASYGTYIIYLNYALADNTIGSAIIEVALGKKGDSAVAKARTISNFNGSEFVSTNIVQDCAVQETTGSSETYIKIFLISDVKGSVLIPYLFNPLQNRQLSFIKY